MEELRAQFLSLLPSSSHMTKSLNTAANLLSTRHISLCKPALQGQFLTHSPGRAFITLVEPNIDGLLDRYRRLEHSVKGLLISA